MKNKDMRRVARKFWRENWFTIFLSYIAGLLGFVLLTMLFSSLLNPFILFTGEFSLGELRRGIGLSLTGILFALYVCVYFLLYCIGILFSKNVAGDVQGRKEGECRYDFLRLSSQFLPPVGKNAGL